MEAIEREINALTHEQMCQLWRSAPAGHKYFNTDLPYWRLFKARFDAFGGMTTEMSKRIGWG